MEKFNYADKNNFIKWFLLIFSGTLTLFFTFLFIRVAINDILMYPLLVPIIGFSIICLITVNKMFLSKIYISENFIEYKSPFTKVRIDRDNIKGIDLIKKPRKRAPQYLSLNERPDFNIGNYFLIIRASYSKPDSTYFLSFSPVEKNYITAEYRSSLFEKLKEYKYI